MNLLHTYYGLYLLLILIREHFNDVKINFKVSFTKCNEFEIVLNFDTILFIIIY